MSSLSGKSYWKRPVSSYFFAKQTVANQLEGISHPLKTDPGQLHSTELPYRKRREHFPVAAPPVRSDARENDERLSTPGALPGKRRLKQMNPAYSFSTTMSGEEIRRLQELLAQTYWASDRTLGEVEQSLRSSVIVSAKHVVDGFVGCARAVTDKVTFAWICDVVVHEAHRRRGLGRELARRLLVHPDVAATRKVLVTKDAQSLYRQLGFETHRFECMIKYSERAQSGAALNGGPPRRWVTGVARRRHEGILKKSTECRFFFAHTCFFEDSVGNQASAKAKAERLITHALGVGGITQKQLASWRKAHPFKVALAAKLRAETAVSVSWIAQQLAIGTRGHLAHLLHLQGQTPAEPQQSNQPRLNI